MASQQAQDQSPEGMEKSTTTTSDVITSSSGQVHPQQPDTRAEVVPFVLRRETVFEQGSTSRSSAPDLAPFSGSACSTSQSSLSPGGHCKLQLPPRPVVPDWVMALASRCQEQHDGARQVIDAVAAQPRFLMTKKITKTDLKRDENRLLIPAGFVNSNLIHFLNDDEKKAASLYDYADKKRKREPEGAPVPPPPEADEGKESKAASLDDKKRKREPEGAPVPPPPEPDEGKESKAASLDDKKRKREPEGAPVPPPEPEEGKEQPFKKRKPMDKGRQHGGLPVTAWTRSRWHFDALRLTCWDRSKATVLKGEHLKYLYDRSFLCDGDQIELWGFRDVHGQLHLALHKSSSTPPLPINSR